MNKRGVSQAILSVMIKLVLIVFILLAIMAGIFNKGSSTAFANQVLAKDIALTIDSLNYADGDVVLDYTQDLGNRIVEIKNHKVYVYEVDKEVAKRFASYTGSEKIKIKDTKLIPDTDKDLKIRFVKNRGEIIITDDDSVTLQASLLTCSQISTVDSDFKNRNLLIDLAHRDDDLDLGSNYGDLKEAEIVDRIGIYLQNPLLTTEFTRQPGVNLVGNRYKVQTDTDIVISLNVGSYDPNMNEIRAYINTRGAKSAESSKLACLILNNIFTYYDIKPTMMYIIPGSDTDPGFDLIDNDRVGVSLEIANLRNPDGRIMLNDPSTVGRSIQEAITEYYNT